MTVYAWLGLLVLAVGCDRSGPVGRSTAATPRVVFVGAAADDPLWPAFRAGAQRFADRVGLVSVEFAAPPSRSPEQQCQLILELLQTKLDGICVQVIDAALLAPVLRRVQTRGVRVVTVGKDVPRDARAGYAGLDEQAAGRALALAVGAALPDGGTVMLLHAGRDSPRFGPRLRAYQEAGGAVPGLFSLGSFDCRADPAEAERIVADKLSRFRLHAIISLGDWPLEAVTQGGLQLPAGCRLIAHGASPRYVSLLEDGRCAALIGADYTAIGYDAVRICATAILDKTVGNRTFLADAHTVRADNLAEHHAHFSPAAPPP